MRHRSGKASLGHGAVVKKNERNHKMLPYAAGKPSKRGVFGDPGAQCCHLPVGGPESMALGFFFLPNPSSRFVLIIDAI